MNECWMGQVEPSREDRSVPIPSLAIRHSCLDAACDMHPTGAWPWQPTGLLRRNGMWRPWVYFLLLVKWAHMSRPEPAWMSSKSQLTDRGEEAPSVCAWAFPGPPACSPCTSAPSLPLNHAAGGHLSLQGSTLAPRPLQSPLRPPRPQKIEFRLSQTSVQFLLSPNTVWIIFSLTFLLKSAHIFTT